LAGSEALKIKGFLKLPIQCAASKVLYKSSTYKKIIGEVRASQETVFAAVHAELLCISQVVQGIYFSKITPLKPHFHANSHSGRCAQLP
jgi:hypothetical protein